MVFPVAIESMTGKKRFFMTHNLRSRYPSMPSAAPAASAPEWPAVRCLKERSYDQYTVSFGRQGYGKDKTGIRVGAAEFRCISIKMRHSRIYIRRGGLFYVKATKGLNIFYMVFPCIKISNQTHLWMNTLIQCQMYGNWSTISFILQIWPSLTNRTYVFASGMVGLFIFHLLPLSVIADSRAETE